MQLHINWPVSQVITVKALLTNGETTRFVILSLLCPLLIPS